MTDRPSTKQQIRVEQALASGRSFDWILTHVTDDEAAVVAVMSRLDQFHIERDAGGAPTPRCGTHAGHLAHLVRGDKPCTRCLTADRAWRLKQDDSDQANRAEAAARGRRRGRSRCGSEAGYSRHRTAGEPACRVCRDAMAPVWRDRKRSRDGRTPRRAA